MYLDVTCAWDPLLYWAYNNFSMLELKLIFLNKSDPLTEHKLTTKSVYIKLHMESANYSS